MWYICAAFEMYKCIWSADVFYIYRQNRTAPGHILGRAQQRPNAPVPERLNAVNNSILRMLVHMSMFLGANRDSQVLVYTNSNKSLVKIAKFNKIIIKGFGWMHVYCNFGVWMCITSTTAVIQILLLLLLYLSSTSMNVSIKTYMNII